jgi:hypothetical protein
MADVTFQIPDILVDKAKLALPSWIAQLAREQAKEELKAAIDTRVEEILLESTTENDAVIVEETIKVIKLDAINNEEKIEDIARGK